MLPSFMFLAQFYITNDYMSGNSMEIFGSRKKKFTTIFGILCPQCFFYKYFSLSVRHYSGGLNGRKHSSHLWCLSLCQWRMSSADPQGSSPNPSVQSELLQERDRGTLIHRSNNNHWRICFPFMDKMGVSCQNSITISGSNWFRHVRRTIYFTRRSSRHYWYLWEMVHFY